MRVTSVDITSSNSSNTISLGFRDPASQNSYIAKEIVGLDADEITPKYYGSDLSGKKYYDLSLAKRGIVLKIVLNPNFSLSDSYSKLRDDLYKLISSSRTGEIQLKFKDGNTVVAAISGFVTKFEAPTFTKSPEMQITILCNDAMLRALDETSVDVSTLPPGLTTIVDDKSTAPHGFRFAVLFSASTVSFSIKDSATPNWLFEVNLTGSPLAQFQAGDQLYGSSETNNRYLYVVRSSVVTHLADKIMPGYIWPIIFPGTNTFLCSDFVSWEHIKYYATYWGI